VEIELGALGAGVVVLLLLAAYGLSAIVASARQVAAALRWLPLVASSLLAATRPFLQQAAASISGGGIRRWPRLVHGVEVIGLSQKLQGGKKDQGEASEHEAETISKNRHRTMNGTLVHSLTRLFLNHCTSHRT